MQAKKPVIVKIVQTELEERAPPDEKEYEFVDTWPKKQTGAATTAIPKTNE